MEEWEESLPDRPSGFQRLYDSLVLLLLMWPATAGMWLLGSTRLWGLAPALFFSLSGSLLVFLRPLVFRNTPRWRWPPGFWIFSVLLAYIIFQVPWAKVPYAARWEALRWLSLLAAAFAWTQVGGSAHRWKWLLGILLMAVALDCLYALIQEASGSSRILWTERPEQYGLRASGTYRCPNHFANMIALLTPLALVLALLPEAGFPLRLMALYFLAVAAPVLYWTESRSGWLSLAGGLAVTWLLLAWRKGRRWLFIVLAILPLLAVAVGWTAWQVLPVVRMRIGAVLDNPEKASGIRVKMWRDMPAMIRDHPAFGYGGGSFVWAYPPYQRAVDRHLTFDFLHNEYLQMQVEYGAVGLGLLLVGLVCVGGGLIRSLLRARDRAAALLLAGTAGGITVSMVHALFDFNFHIYPNPQALVWIGGVSWSVWFLHEQGMELPRGREKRLQQVWGAAGAILCALGAWLTLIGGVSYVWNLKGEFARSSLDWDKAANCYRRAIHWDPGNWQPHLGLGNLLVAQARWFRDLDPVVERDERIRLAAESAEQFGQSLTLNPGDMAAEVGLAHTFNVRGEPEAALEHFQRAAAYQRRHVFYREQLGIQLRRMGQDAEALAVFRRNIEDNVATDVSVLNIRALERLSARGATPAPPGTSAVPARTDP